MKYQEFNGDLKVILFFRSKIYYLIKKYTYLNIFVNIKCIIMGYYIFER